MQKQICDICELRDATQSYQIRKSRRTIRDCLPLPFRFGIWSEWETVDMCEECAEKLFNATKNK